MPVRFGEFVFDSATRELSRGGEPVPLAPKAFDLLQALIEERPRAMRKEELRERLWPDVVVDEANLKNLIGEIRAALADKKVIRTVHRYGYAFVGDLKSTEEATSARLIEGDRIHRLKSGENLIGRAEDCAVVLDFTGVSRHHAKVTVQNGRFVLEDLGSKNGTWKNEERLRESVDLRDGDRIRIGGVPLIFRSQSRPVTTATVRGG